MREMLMWTCSRGAGNNIHLCGERSVNSQTLSLRSRFFKEKYIHNHPDVDIYFASLERKNKFGVTRTLPCLLAR